MPAREPGMPRPPDVDGSNPYRPTFEKNPPVGV